VTVVAAAAGLQTALTVIFVQLFVAAPAPASVTTPVHRTRLSKAPESPIFQRKGNTQ
jgi:hypothetical protein